MWWRQLGRPIVVKLDGLAAGKGVSVPTTAAETEAAIAAAADSGAFVVEERMTGPECTLLVLCDGRTGVSLPLAQDHKRIGEGDTGANTGGMGAYAPAPVPFPAEDLTATFAQPVLDHLAAAGTPYVGVLYVGLMLTPDGPRLVEYNVRFGDPEAQAVLPLLDSDLAALALACTEGDAARVPVRLRDGAAVTVVAASAGYPSAATTGEAVVDTGLDAASAIRFDAAVDADGRTAGGRVLAVTGLGADLSSARANAYARLERISFRGMQVRRDIGWRAPGAALTSYAAAGVDIDEGTRAVDEMRAGSSPRTMWRPGARCCRASAASVGCSRRARSPSSTTRSWSPRPTASAQKQRLPRRWGAMTPSGRTSSITASTTFWCRALAPLFFMDYIAMAKLDPVMVAQVVRGCAEACRLAGCALLGGETAEMPGVYAPGEFDLVGTIVGVVDRKCIIDGSRIAPGDAVLGLASSGLHTNGYSLARRVLADFDLATTPEGLGVTLGDALLAPHRNYFREVETLAGRALTSRAWRTSPAAGCPRTCPACSRTGSAPRSCSDRGLSRRCSGSSRSSPRTCHSRSVTGRSTWESGWSSCALQARSTPYGRRSPSRPGRSATSCPVHGPSR